MFADQMDLTVALHSTFLGGDRQPRQGLSDREKEQASRLQPLAWPGQLLWPDSSCVFRKVQLHLHHMQATNSASPLRGHTRHEGLSGRALPA